MNDSSGSGSPGDPAEPPPEELPNPDLSAPLLLVQCCRLPQFFFVARKIRQHYPNQPLEALIRDTEESRYAVDKLPPFERVHWLGTDARGQWQDKPFSGIVLPLLNRGFGSIKRAIQNLNAPLLETDYNATLRPLVRRRLWMSLFRPLCPLDEDFLPFFERFPLPPLGDNVLLVESCHSSLLEKTRNLWQKAASPSGKLTRLTRQDRLSFKELRRRRFDSAVVFFSGEFGFTRLKMLPFLLGAAKIRLIDEKGRHLQVSPAGLAGFLFHRMIFGAAQPKLKPSVLFVQTEAVPYMQEAIRKLREQSQFTGSKISILCRRDDAADFDSMPEVEQVLTFSRGQKQNWLRGVFKNAPDVIASVFSGRAVFRKQKLFGLLLADRPHLIFNAQLESYRLTPGNLLRVFRREPLRRDLALQTRQKVLFVQTEGRLYTRKVLERLKEDGMFPHSEVWLLCRQEDSLEFRGAPEVSRVLAYETGGLKEWWSLLPQIRRFSPDVITAVFSGRRIFLKQKLFFLSLLHRPRLVFNAALDCFWMGPTKWPLLLRRGAQLEEEVLLVQTEADEQCLQAIDILLAGHVVVQKTVSILCNKDKQALFSRHPAVSRIYTYEKGQIRTNLRLYLDLCKRRPHVLAAILSGRRTFRLPKLMFFLISGRHRLVFNESLDCFYLQATGFRSLLLPGNLYRLIAHRVSSPLADGSLLYLWSRPLAKGILFLPRFLYLLAWVSFAKMKRAYRLSKEAGD